MKKRRMSDYATWIVGTMALLLSLVAGCGNREVREIRADFEKIPDFFLGKRHGGQAFVQYTYVRIGDLPDEVLRRQLMREFTDRLFSFDFKEHYPLEDLGWSEKQDAVDNIANGLWLRRCISKSAKTMLMRFNFPLSECWEVRFRYLEKDRSCRKWMAQALNRPFDIDNYSTEISFMEEEILSDRDHNRLSPDDFVTVRARLEQILGRPMRTKEQLDEERKKRESRSH